MPQPSLPSPKCPPRAGRASSINPRTIAAPLAAFTMALLLFTYTRTSIRAAKANAQRHREADSGGEGLSLVQENRRRHGLAERVEGGGKGGTVGELVGEMMGRNRKVGQDDGGGGEKGMEVRSGEEEKKLRTLRGSRRGMGNGVEEG